jgi:hypothetical protein
MIFFGERHLQYSIDEFLEYYHGERNHQGLGGQIIDETKSIGSSEGKLPQRERLGGMLNYYYRRAAKRIEFLYGTGSCAGKSFSSWIAIPRSMPHSVACLLLLP